MLVAIQRGRQEHYTGIFFGKGPMQNLYTVAYVFGEKMVKKEILSRDEVAKRIRSARACRPIRDSFGDDSWTVEIKKTAGATMKV